MRPYTEQIAKGNEMQFNISSNVYPGKRCGNIKTINDTNKFVTKLWVLCQLYGTDRLGETIFKLMKCIMRVRDKERHFLALVFSNMDSNCIRVL